MASGPSWAKFVRQNDHRGAQTFIVGLSGDRSMGAQADFLGGEVTAVNEKAGFMVVKTSDARTLKALARLDDRVRYIAEDRPDAVKALAAPNDPAYYKQWGLKASPGTDAETAWETVPGSTSTIVAVVDSGIEASHPDLGNLLPGYDFINGDGVPEDDCGHGTHVAGIVGALRDNGIGVAGVTETTILPVKALKNSGSGCAGSFSAVANGIIYAADQGADVISLSLGCAGCFNTAMEDAMAYAVQQGAIVVAAAGNGYGGQVVYPATSQHAMAVSAIDRYGRMASFSSVGPEVEIAAPGLSIYNTYLDGSYGYLSGTSMATPHVSGAAAALASTGAFTSAEIREHLKATATDLGLSAQEQGAGALNLAAAVADLGGAPEPEPEPNTPPTAGMSVTCQELTCQLDASTSSDADGDALTYSWSLGDGTSLTGETTTHTYAAGGTYTVQLTVTDPDGASDTSTDTVTVSEPAPEPEPNTPPTAGMSVTCQELTCQLDASSSSDADGDALTYSWALGDGTTLTGETVSHTYSQDGGYTITLTVADPDGASDQASQSVTVSAPPADDGVNERPEASFTVSCDGLTCTFDASSTTDPDGDELTYGWYFGDNFFDYGEVVTHTYYNPGDYAVYLDVKDPDKKSDQAWQMISVQEAPDEPEDPQPEPNTPPTASMSATCQELTCQLDASTSSDADGDALTYSWSLGDGTTLTGETATHTYAAGGTYTVQLTVTDPDGASDTSTDTVTVSEPNQAPSAGMSVTCQELTCQLDASSSSDADGDALSYSWSLGDGSTLTGETASHTYAAGGAYTVTLTVADPDGATATASETVQVTEPAQPPTAGFSVTCTDLACQLDGSPSSDPEGEQLTYTWNLGDGTTLTGETASHTYDAAGTYTVELTVSDPSGLTDTTSQSVTVTAPAPEPEPEPEPEPSGPAVHVADIEHTHGRHFLSVVTVHDENGAPKPGVEVKGTVCKNGSVCIPFYDVTDSQGEARFMWHRAGQGTFETCVTELNEPGYEWDQSRDSASEGACHTTS